MNEGTKGFLFCIVRACESRIWSHGGERKQRYKKVSRCDANKVLTADQTKNDT